MANKLGQDKPISQSAAARILQVHRKTWENWESGKPVPYSVLLALSAVYSGVLEWPRAIAWQHELDSLRVSMESLGSLQKDVIERSKKPKSS